MSSTAGGTRAPFALVVSLPGRLHVHASSMADAAELASAQLAKEAPSAILPGRWTERPCYVDFGAPASWIVREGDRVLYETYALPHTLPAGQDFVPILSYLQSLRDGELRPEVTEYPDCCE